MTKSIALTLLLVAGIASTSPSFAGPRNSGVSSSEKAMAVAEFKALKQRVDNLEADQKKDDKKDDGRGGERK